MIVSSEHFPYQLYGCTKQHEAPVLQLIFFWKMPHQLTWPLICLIDLIFSFAQPILTTAYRPINYGPLFTKHNPIISEEKISEKGKKKRR